MKIWIDFETYSRIDIKKCGLYKYIYDPSFEVLCIGYAVDDGHVSIEVEYLDYLMQKIYLDANLIIYAHNAEFEYNVFKRMGYEIPLKRFVDTMALAGTYGYPLGLDDFCIAIGMEHGKDPAGTRLKTKLCTPQKKTIKNPKGRILPEDDPKEFERLYAYNKRDVECMREAVSLLPTDKLTPLEQLIWCHTVMQNERGVAIDIASVRSIIMIMNDFTTELTAEYRELTGLNTVKQAVKLREWFHSRKCRIPNLQADTVTEFLAKPELSYECKRVLELRQALAYSSTAKFEKMLWMIQEDGRVRGNLAYHAAHTGRWAGRGFQWHNLPRFSHQEPEKVLEIFNRQPYPIVKYHYPDINKTASGLVRPVLIADKDMKLCVGDYKSIENVVLHWIAGDEKTTKDFKNGLDQYKVYSSDRLKKPYNEITKEERQQSKPDVLGLGYGAGPGSLIGVAAGYGVDLSMNEAKKRVTYYRNKYKEVVKFWNNVYTKALFAIKHDEQKEYITPTIKLIFTFDGDNLWITLPSTRNLFYRDVKIDAVWYINVKGKKIPMTSEISYMGLKNNQWVRIGTHPGMLTENIVQALARDCLAYGLLCVEQAGYKVLGSVHDEIITEVEDSEYYTVKEMCRHMCKKQTWNDSLPLSADGWEGYRYKKD